MSAQRFARSCGAARFGIAGLLLLASCRDEATAPSTPSPDVTASATVTLRPGARIQDSVTKYAGGTSFLLKAGVYRLQTVTPKNGMTFAGEVGAVLSGARLLTSFTHQGSYWVVGNQTQQGQRILEIRPSGKPNCLPEYPRCAYPEELFVNNVRLRHVSSLSQVGPGSWFFDYAADKIYLGQDPTGKIVETSVTPRGIVSTAANVTIRGLVVEKYASPLTFSAIEAAGSNWLIEDNEVRYNHGIGIETGEGTIARRNKTHHNLQLGMAGTGNNTLVEDNEISYNNYPQQIDYSWGAGGTKWHDTQHLTVRGNFIHHNMGHGLWTDIDNIYTLFEHNRVEDNGSSGINHEISYDAVIRYNTSARNGNDAFNSTYLGIRGGGIAVRSSRNVEIYGNTLTNNRAGFDIAQSKPNSGKYGAYEVANLYVHDNTVTILKRMSGFSVITGDPVFYTSKNNRFRNNKYYLGTQARPFWWWNASASKQDSLTITQWKAAGQDVGGSFIRQ